MMKKIIALALALSMALSMVAFAGYTDAALINEDLTADIDLVKALGLMTGNPDGSFNPKGTLTRGEAAVIIYRLKSAKSTIDASWSDASLNSFTDMAGHWSAPYVNYCAALGLITGDPAGTFRPNDAVTAVEMAKMLLNVLGYDTEKQQYGPKWPAAVLADASDAGLFADYEAAFTAPAAREWVAKMVANILDAQTVSYNVYTNALVKNTKNDEPVLFGEQYGVKTQKGFAFANEVTKMATGAIEAEVSEVVLTRGDYSTKVDIDFNIPSELIGHNVKVYYKGADLENATKIYAVMDDAKKVVTTTIDKVTLSSAGVLKADGVELDDEVGTVNYWSSNKAASKFIGSTAKRDSREVTLVQNGTTWDLFTTNTVYTKVTKNDAEKTTFNTEGTYTFETTDEETYGEIVFNDTVAKDDIVCVETLADGTVVVSKVNALTSKISSVYNGTDIVVAGTTYKSAQNAVSELGVSTLPSSTSNIKNKTYDIYTDGKYYVYVGEHRDNTTVVPGLDLNVAYLIDGIAASTSTFEQTTDRVQVMFADGTIAIYEYDDSDTAAVDFDFDNGNNAGTVYEYALNEDGTISFYTVTVTKDAEGNDVAAFDTTNTPAKFDVKETLAKSFLQVNSAPIYANEDSFFFVKQSYLPANKADTEANYVTKYSVVKASEIKADIEGGVWAFDKQTAYTLDKSGFNTLAYGVLTGDSTSASNKSEASKLPVATSVGKIFIATDTAKANLNATATTYSLKGINADGVAETITLDYNKVDKTGATIEKGKVYVIKTEGTKTYLTGASISDSTISAAGWYKTTVKAATDSLIVLADDVMRDLKDVNIITVNAKWAANKEYVSADGTFSVGAELDLIPNGDKVVFVKINADGDVTDIIVTFTYNTDDKDYEDQDHANFVLAY